MTADGWPGVVTTPGQERRPAKVKLHDHFMGGRSTLSSDEEAQALAAAEIILFFSLVAALHAGGPWPVTRSCRRASRALFRYSGLTADQRLDLCRRIALTGADLLGMIER